MALFHFPSQVNERAARLVAVGVVLTLTLALVSNVHWLVAVVAFGFLLRVAWGPKVSPLGRIAVALAGELWEQRPVSGAPKRFAQAVGVGFSAAASVLLFTGHVVFGWSLVGVLVAFASLEAGAGFCAGCFVYARLQARGWLPADACVDCAPKPNSGSAPDAV